MNAYYESCPECDSLNIRIAEEGLESFTVLCYDCGFEWEDWDD